MYSRRDIDILKTLSKLGVATFSELKTETGLPPGTLTRGLKSLAQAEKILHQRTYYALPEFREDLENKVEKDKSPRGVPIQINPKAEVHLLNRSGDAIVCRSCKKDLDAYYVKTHPTSKVRCHECRAILDPPFEILALHTL